MLTSLVASDIGLLLNLNLFAAACALTTALLIPLFELVQFKCTRERSSIRRVLLDRLLTIVEHPQAVWPTLPYR